MHIITKFCKIIVFFGIYLKIIYFQCEQRLYVLFWALEIGPIQGHPSHGQSADPTNFSLQKAETAPA